MKKYIYGTILVVVIAATWIFFPNPPAVTNRTAFRVLAVTFRFPEGYELTEGAPFTLTWQAESPEGTRSVPVKVRNFNPLVSPFKFDLMPPPGSVAVVLRARLYYCHKTSRMCFQNDFQTRVPLVSRIAGVISWVWKITPSSRFTGREPRATKDRVVRGTNNVVQLL
jgi:hypothetical protein